MKIPWRIVLKVVGITATGAAAAWGAAESDAKVQKFIKMVASKTFETMGKES